MEADGALATTNRSTPRILAIDYSGDLRDARRRIWVAEAGESQQLALLECGRSREEMVDWLLMQARTTPKMIVGIDFAFSFPEWFLRDRGFRDAPALWAAAAQHGEIWLRECPRPFWGLRGRPRPANVVEFRRTDSEMPTTGGIKPKSVFQIGGAGAVGTGSVRGMATLHRLADTFSVWPLVALSLPLIIEIYPRVLTGRVTKSSAEKRRSYLDAHYPTLNTDMRAKAASSEDAFDAAVSALVMAAHVEALQRLPVARDDTDRLEGRIWYPCQAERCNESLQKGQPEDIKPASELVKAIRLIVDGYADLLHVAEDLLQRAEAGGQISAAEVQLHRKKLAALNTDLEHVRGAVDVAPSGQPR